MSSDALLAKLISGANNSTTSKTLDSDILCKSYVYVAFTNSF